jgi:1-deoxyxylulose-5-phosphate synthase
VEYTNLGPTGLKVSRICLGCMSFGGTKTGNFAWTLGYDESKKIIDRAVELGINFFDTANVYSEGMSEDIVGRALQGRRDDMVLATKVYNPMGVGPNDKGLSRRHMLRAVRASLGRLRTDYIDLYQTHRWDYETPIEETLKTLDDLVHEQGVVRYIGASSMWAWQLAKSLYISDRLGLERFVSMQNHYNLAYREEEREVIPLCMEERIGLIPWSPLARGFLSGRYRRNEKPEGARYAGDQYLKARYFRPEDFDVVERLESVAREKGVTNSQLALAWLLHKRFIAAPIVGVTTVAQLEELVGALDVKLTDEETRRLEEPYRPRAIEGHT